MLSIFARRAVTRPFHSGKAIDNLSVALSCYTYNPGYYKAKQKGHIDLEILANYDVTEIKRVLMILFSKDYSDKSITLLDKQFFSIKELLDCSKELRDDYLNKEVCNDLTDPSCIGKTTLARFLEKKSQFSLDETIDQYHRDRSSTPTM